MPATMFSSVDLPEPDSPTTATHSPAATLRSIAWNSGCPPNDFARPWTSSMEGAPALTPGASGPGDDAEDRASEGRHRRRREQPALLREHRDRGERDGDLQQRHRDREEMVRMQGMRALLEERLGLFLVGARFLLDVRLLALVARGLRVVLAGHLGVGGERRGDLRQVLLLALRLVEIPLVRGLGALQHRIVLEEDRLVLRVPAEEAHDGAHRGEDGGKDGDLLAEAALVGLVLD